MSLCVGLAHSPGSKALLPLKSTQRVTARKATLRPAVYVPSTLMPGRLSAQNEPVSQQSRRPSPSASGALPVTWSHAAGNRRGAPLACPRSPPGSSKATSALDEVKAFLVHSASFSWDANVPGSSGTPEATAGILAPFSDRTRLPLALSSWRIDAGTSGPTRDTTASHATNKLTPATPTPATGPAQPDGMDMTAATLAREEGSNATHPSGPTV